MLNQSEINKVPRNDHTRKENKNTQPLKRQNVFNEPFVMTQGWYPVCPSKKIKTEMARSFLFLEQRIVIYRGKSGRVYALDSFCPHMGADLGNGHVSGESLNCFFHHWKFNCKGESVQASKDNRKCLNAYPVKEKYNFIWVFAAAKATHDIPHPPALEGKDVEAVHFKRIRLFAHHHVMMVGGVDLKHFKTVHGLDVEFNFESEEKEESCFLWNLKGEIPKQGWLTKWAHWLTGGVFNYQVLFAGGSIATISYGQNLRFKGKGFKLPMAHILWGAVPQRSGVSDVDIFFVLEKQKGLFGKIKKWCSLLFTIFLLTKLKDDDIKAFPHMRFQLGDLTKGDESVAELATLLSTVPVSPWTKNS